VSWIGIFNSAFLFINIFHFIKKSSSKNIVSVCSKHDKNAKKCILNYHVISCLPDYSLINVHLLTGRSHQIRVQFSSRGHSIVGDVKYGSAEKLRGHIALWAYKLSFFHPTKKEKMEFTYFPGGPSVQFVSYLTSVNK